MTGEWRHFPTIDPGPVFCALDHEDWPCERERVQLRVEELERALRDAEFALNLAINATADDRSWWAEGCLAYDEAHRVLEEAP